MLVEMMMAMSASASAPTPQKVVEIDGEKIAYSATTDAAGNRQIRGERLRDGKIFRFLVKSRGRVAGFVGATPVEFRMGGAL